MSKRPRVSEGDWICSDKSCKNVNFARRTECNRCGASRNTGEMFKKSAGEIGKNFAEKSKGLFSADDWQCKKCGNINWARRNDCNVCSAPKFDKVEHRTGLGGGFNERGTVEYKERVESDDEYDEFGRKKRKFRQNPGAPSKPPPHKQDEEEEDDDEDDDDDEDNGNSSKYDLGADSEEEEDGSEEDASKYDLADDEEEIDLSASFGRRSSREGRSEELRRSRSRSRSPLDQTRR